MAKITFSDFPAEIHVSIAQHCENSDLKNFCLTSKLMKERCLRLLFRHVDLRLKSPAEASDARNRQTQFVHTLLRHPDYGKHVRYLQGTLFIPSLNQSDGGKKEPPSDEDLWSAMQLLTHVQSVDVGFRNDLPCANRIGVPTAQFPTGLFQSATSVRLVDHMPYGLAKSILDVVNPATLKHLCLDMVQDCKAGQRQRGYLPEDRGEDGRMIALGAMVGLLTTLTGACAALRVLTLRRLGQQQIGSNWNEAAEEVSYIEWASFICSVRTTVEKFTFEQAGSSALGATGFTDEDGTLRVMDERFRKFILPAILSGNWPCLTVMELRGARTAEDQGGKTALIAELRAVLGGNAEIVVDEQVHKAKGIW
ncbi:hypothetical protein MMC07_009929 [Pseudocyphellaria aurata]|nr:hypothetical protein [Pseudocyphellaria aurata]